MNQFRNLKVTLFGGTGFLGRYLIKHLCNNECIITVPTRNPAKAYFLQPLGDVGQIKLIKYDLSDDKTLKHIIEDSDVIINLVGILFENKKNDFNEIHYNFVKKLINNMKANKKIIHLSALGVDRCKDSLYAISKFNAEKYIQKKSKNFLIIRPSLIFGPEDNFFNRFAKMILLSPFLPLIMGGKTKFQPVYVEDVCKGIIKIIRLNNFNLIYEFGGPDIYSFKQLMNILLKSINRKRILLYTPKKIAILMAKFFQILPNPLITEDQIKLLNYDNIVLNNHLTFKELKINPTSLELIIPNYLKRFKKY